MVQEKRHAFDVRVGWIVLFWGALWGVAEATLGFVLHAAAAAMPGIQGFVMFPIAFCLMAGAVSTSARPGSAFAAACVAAAVKLTDFLVPGAMPLRVLNPAAAILMEGLAVWGVMAWMKRRGTAPDIRHALVASLLWRALFLGDQGVLAGLAIPAGLATNGLAASLRFLLLEGAVNALLIGLWLAVSRHFVPKRAAEGARFVPAMPVMSVMLFVLAVAVQRLLG